MDENDLADLKRDLADLKHGIGLLIMLLKTGSIPADPGLLSRFGIEMEEKSDIVNPFGK